VLPVGVFRRLAARYRRSPDQLSEEEVRGYLLGLRERGVALGTFKAYHGGIQFLYRRTLDRDWALFQKKVRPPKQLRLPEVPSITSTMNRAKCFSGSHSSTEGGSRYPVFRSIARKLLMQLSS
jgi:Phage integrase, N-terminal SAM-like domain